ncbi:hypothetical protein SNE40_005242 [Patella caerulea]|uniref:Glyoxylate reductase/hydroxypyruvate reductase n=1 Tax=Patella caerulea TaxID=87958 RepID=A0AAN8QB43_PATCE
MSAKPIVFFTRSAPPNGVALLAQDCELRIWESEDPIPREELLRRVKGVNALFVHPPIRVDSELFDAAGPQLKVVGTMSVGLDHIDLAECKKRNIPVGNTPGVLTSAVAELTVTLLLATARRMKAAFQAVHNGTWGTWESGMWMTGTLLEGKTLGVVGLGRIGMAATRRLKPFGFSRILYCGRNKKTYDAEVGAEFVDFFQLLKDSDIVIATCSITDENKGLFNKHAFKAMKNTAIFINVTRGALVNQDDLFEALTTGEIGSAGIDVTTPEPLPTDDKLLNLSNLTVSPHIGSATVESRSAMCELTARNILAGLKGGPLPSPVLF